MAYIPNQIGTPGLTEHLATLKKIISIALPQTLPDDRHSGSTSKRRATSPLYGALTAYDHVQEPIAAIQWWAEQQTATTVEADLYLRRDLWDDLDQTSTLVELWHRTRSLMPTDVPVQYWSRPTTPAWEQTAAVLNAEPQRRLFKMRLSADFPDTNPDPPTGATVKPFSDDMADQVVKVNARAFADHPDQGRLTFEQFKSQTNQKWFNPAGLRVWFVDDTLAAFCWTKTYDEPRAAELYVVGVDPNFQRQGFGATITTEALRWLKDRRHDNIFLYVESTNGRAIALYEQLGFSTALVDTCWSTPATPS